MLLPGIDDLPPDHRSGFVALIGRPNVGKSTLLNALLKQKVAITSPKPQTTRNRLLGILTRPDAQLIFVDTPGIHQPKHKLGEFMVNQAVGAVPDADVILWVVDVSQVPTPEDQTIGGMLQQPARSLPVILGFNKVDLVDGATLQDRRAVYQTLLPGVDSATFSAAQRLYLDDLLVTLIDRLPPGPRFYPSDQVTDLQERFIVAEFIREQALRYLREEIPYALAVVVEEFKPRSAEMTYIAATVYVERDTHKGIVLGRGGQMLKRIGQQARQEIERLLGTRVFLELHVKVVPHWRGNEAYLRRLGYRGDR